MKSNGFDPCGRSAEHGFTLIELMVSLLIFGVLAAGGVALLRFSVDAQASASTRLAEMATQRRIASLLTADLAQAIPRITRNQNGDALPAFVGESGGAGANALMFVRGGWENLDGAPRPTLQKVAYRLNGRALVRLAYPMLDGAAPGEAAPLLDDVETVRLRYRGKDGWRERWDSIDATAMPRAVEMVVRQARGPETRFLFLVGSAS